MTLRRQGMIRNIFKWTGIMMLGMGLGILISFGFWYWQNLQLEKAEPIVLDQVWTVTRPIEMGQYLDAEDLMPISVNRDYIPATAILEVGEWVGKKAWVNLQPKMILLEDFFWERAMPLSENQQELKLELPDQLEVGDYVDVRIKFPSGHDYCVLSHKQVGNVNSEAAKILLSLSEPERIRLSSALTDVTIYDSSYFYLSVYPKAVDAPKTIVRYPVNGSVQALYEVVMEEKVDGSERKNLELALEQMKAENKFLSAQSEELLDDTEPIPAAGEVKKASQPDSGTEGKKEKETNHKEGKELKPKSQEADLEEEIPEPTPVEIRF